MAIDIDRILERIRDVDIKGISLVERIGVGDKNYPVVEVHFLRIKGALQNDPAEHFRMIIGADDPEEYPNDLRFVVVGVNKCEPFSKDITVYMDANWNTSFGAHNWDPRDGEIRFSYLMPLPSDAPQHPDTVLLRRMLKDMYSGLLLHDIRTMSWVIGEDEMLNEDEKKAKCERLASVANKLMGPRSDDDGVI